eukprot:600428-Pyramimonas_sp.AAC.1
MRGRGPFAKAAACARPPGGGRGAGSAGPEVASRCSRAAQRSADRAPEATLARGRSRARPG